MRWCLIEHRGKFTFTFSFHFRSKKLNFENEWRSGLATVEELSSNFRTTAHCLLLFVFLPTRATSGWRPWIITAAKPVSYWSKVREYLTVCFSRRYRRANHIVTVDSPRSSVCGARVYQKCAASAAGCLHLSLSLLALVGRGCCFCICCVLGKCCSLQQQHIAAQDSKVKLSHCLTN
jgi:hypothetical protein